MQEVVRHVRNTILPTSTSEPSRSCVRRWLMAPQLSTIDFGRCFEVPEEGGFPTGWERASLK